MSSNSLRNSLHRRNHKERGQLAHRTRLGLLEKHKDYALRARDYHSKQDRIRRLKQKAADRNQDEFYFGMVNQRTKDGVHVHERGNTAMPVDVVKLLKTQDGNYIRTVRAAGAKRIDALKNELGAVADLDWQDEDLAPEERRALQDAGLLPPAPGSSSKKRKRAAPKHVVFVDSREQAQSISESKKTKTVEPEAEDAPPEEDLGWIPEPSTSKRKRSSAAASQPQNTNVALAGDEDEGGGSKRHRSQLIKELAARLARDKSLKYTERELEMQRLLMGKGQAKKLRGAEKVGADDDDDDDDDFDVPKKGRSKKPTKMTPEQEAAWKPRVYKWKFDRRR